MELREELLATKSRDAFISICKRENLQIEDVAKLGEDVLRHFFTSLRSKNMLPESQGEDIDDFLIEPPIRIQ